VAVHPQRLNLGTGYLDDSSYKTEIHLALEFSSNNINSDLELACENASHQIIHEHFLNYIFEMKC
jgi:hypothetical protein